MHLQAEHRKRLANAAYREGGMADRQRIQRRKEVRTARIALFILLRQMHCETDPIEPGHVGIESPMFTFFYCPPEGLLTAGSDPLSQGALGVFFLAWSERPLVAQSQAMRGFHAWGLHAPENVGHCLSWDMKVSHQYMREAYESLQGGWEEEREEGRTAGLMW